MPFRLGNLAHEDVVRAAGRTARPRDRFRVLLELGHEVAHRLEGRGRRNHDNQRLTREAGDRGHVEDRHRALVGNARADHHHAADHDGVALALLLAHETRKADHAAGAAHVLDLEFAEDAIGTHGGFDRTAGRVPATARCRRDEDIEAGNRLCLRRGDGRKSDTKAAAPAALISECHDVSSKGYPPD